jgi:hypothetical protein
MGLPALIAFLVVLYLAMFLGIWWLRGLGFRDLWPWGLPSLRGSSAKTPAPTDTRSGSSARPRASTEADPPEAQPCA